MIPPSCQGQALIRLHQRAAFRVKQESGFGFSSVCLSPASRRPGCRQGHPAWPALERTGDARATQVTLSLRSQPEGVELRIKDDGRGFDPTRVQPGRLGLDILRERAEAIGATLQITSQADQGTEIAVIWSDTQQRERKAND
jgi:signal transduction histidine kinase